MSSKRYALFLHRGAHLLLPKTCATIISAVQNGNNTYEQLRKATRLPTDSLYVFCQRLEDAGLLSRTRKVSGEVKRTSTEIKVMRGVRELNLSVVS